MFTASAIAFIGSRVFELNPDFVKTYWDYDDAFLILALGLPRLAYPKGYSARDKMLEAMKKWVKSVNAHFDEEKDGDVDWDEHFGSKFIRKQTQTLAGAGISQDGQAAAIMSLVWPWDSPNPTHQLFTD